MKKSYVSLKRKPLMTPLWLAAIAAVVVISFASWLWSTADSTTVVVIRHAEQQAGAGDDPPLSPAGEARAQLLARVFGDAPGPGRIGAIYVSSTARSRLTAAPLAAKLGLTPVIVAAGDAHALVRRVLHEHPGDRVLIVGRADTMPAIVADLSGVGLIPDVASPDYGTIYVVTVPRIGHANLLRLSY